MVPEGKIPCQSCGAEILPSTAQRNAGRCKPCANGTRAAIDSAKAWYLEPRKDVPATRDQLPRPSPRLPSEFPACPKCGLPTAVLPIRYGFGPAATPLNRLLPNGSGYSGGHCSLEADEYAWRCGDCEFSFGRLADEPEYSWLDEKE